jgi:hypothetical protein
MGMNYPTNSQSDYVLGQVFDSINNQLKTSGGGGGSAVTIADGADVTLGAKGDTAWDGSAASTTAMAIFKKIYSTLAGVLTVAVQKAATGAATTATITTSATVLALNASRKGATIFNESGDPLYVMLGASASVTVYAVQIAVGGYYEVPFGYTGIITGIAKSGNSTVARVVELT